MGRLLRRLRRFFTRGKRIERHIDRLADRVRALEEAQTATALEVKSLVELAGKLVELAGKLSDAVKVLREQEAERAAQPTYTARELLDEYLNGENGDE